jgi:hypothetical protein
MSGATGALFDRLSPENICVIFSFLHESELVGPLETCKMFNGTLQSSVYVRTIGGPFEDTLNKAISAIEKRATDSILTPAPSASAKALDFVTFCRDHIGMLQSLFKRLLQSKESILSNAPSNIDDMRGRVAEMWKIGIGVVSTDQVLLKLKLLNIAVRQSLEMKKMTCDLHDLTRCCNNVRPGGVEDVLIREMLGTFLSLGNYLSPKDEDASGFHFSSLKNIDAVKSTLHEDYNLQHHGCVIWLRKHVQETGCSPKQARADLEGLIRVLETIQFAYQPYSVYSVFSRKWKVDFENVHQELSLCNDSLGNDNDRLMKVSSFFIGLMRPSVGDLLHLQEATKILCSDYAKYLGLGYTSGGFSEGRIFGDLGAIIELLKFAASDTCEKASFCIEIAMEHLRERGQSCEKPHGDSKLGDGQKRPSFSVGEIPSNDTFNARLNFVREVHEKAKEPVVSTPLVLSENEKPSREAFQNSQLALSASLGGKWATATVQTLSAMSLSKSSSIEKTAHLGEKLELGFECDAALASAAEGSSTGDVRKQAEGEQEPTITNMHPPDLQTQPEGSASPKLEAASRRSRVLGTFGGKVLTVAEPSSDDSHSALKKWYWNAMYETPPGYSNECIWGTVQDDWTKLDTRNVDVLNVMFESGSSHMFHSQFQEMQKLFTMEDYHNVQSKSKTNLDTILDVFLKQVPKEVLAASKGAGTNAETKGQPVKSGEAGSSTAIATQVSAKNEAILFSYSDIKAMLNDSSNKAANLSGHGVQRSALEDHLKEEDFALAFKMGRVKFKQLPKWKQNNLKKQAGLF